jgi:hypothetical protein
MLVVAVWIVVAACKLSRHELNAARRDVEEVERLFATMACDDDGAYNRSNALLRSTIHRLWTCTL